MMRGMLVAAVLAVLGACTSEAEGTNLTPEVPPAQRWAVEDDGDVSVAELRTAFERAVDCMRSRGLSVLKSSVVANASEVVTVDVAYKSGDDPDATAAIETNCRDQYFEALFGFYAAAHAPDRDEMKQIGQRIADCLKALGLPIDPAAGADQLGKLQLDYPAEFGKCSSQVQNGS